MLFSIRSRFPEFQWQSQEAFEKLRGLILSWVEMHQAHTMDMIWVLGEMTRMGVTVFNKILV